MTSIDIEQNAGAAFRVVFVCTANRARSPLAEALLRRHVAGLPVDVSSRGTDDAGVEPLAHAIEAGDARGVDIRRHRARAIHRGELHDADLVVGFEPFHVAAAVVVGEAESARTFTLGELAGLLENVNLGGATGVDRARLALEAAHARRAGNARQLSVPSLADPAGRGRRVFMQTAREIDALTAVLASGLFAASSGQTAGTGRRGWRDV